MAMKVSRKEFLGVDELGVPEPEVVAAKMALDFEAAVFVEMKRQGLRQKDLAEAMGVTAATVSKTLSETSNMTFKTAARIANALGCTLDAPTLHPFDVEEYDAMYTVSETAPTYVSTTSFEGDYRSVNRTGAMRKVAAQQTPRSMGASVFGASADGRLSA